MSVTNGKGEYRYLTAAEERDRTCTYCGKNAPMKETDICERCYLEEFDYE